MIYAFLALVYLLIGVVVAAIIRRRCDEVDEDIVPHLALFFWPISLTLLEVAVLSEYMDDLEKANKAKKREKALEEAERERLFKEFLER